MKKALITLLALVFTSSANAADIYKVDPTHASINWTANHFGLSNQSGKITDVTGSIILDEITPKNSSIDVQIGTASLVTGLSKFDEHLKSADFLNVVKFPNATFKSTEVTPAGKTAKVKGDLTLLGITKSITLDAKLVKIGLNPITQKKTAGLFATTTLKRSDFGITFGEPGVSDSVKITIDLEASFVASDNAPVEGAAPILSKTSAKKTVTAVVPEWKIIPAKSKLEFKATQDNSVVSGSFKKFDGTILFDKKQLAKSKISIDIDTSSIEVSFAEATASIQGTDWLSTKAFPKANFTADKIVLLSDANIALMNDVNLNNNNSRPSNYRASGNLTIKGKSIPTSVDFTITSITNTQATANGKVKIKRSAFGIGDKDVKKANGVKDDVEVTFTVNAER